MTSPDFDTSMKCQVCGEELSPTSAYACARCSAPHHADCWAFNGKCAIFGCGGQEVVPFGELPAVVQARNVHITEHTRPGFSLEPYVEALGRKLVTRAKDLPKTLGAGLVGSTLTILGFMTFVQSSTPRDATLYLGLLFCGLGPGLVAPFVAPTQQRRPLLSTTITGALFFLFYSMRFGDWRFLWSTMTVAAGILFVTSLSEAVLGKFTPLGNALGKAAAPIRHLSSWVFFLLAIWIGAALNGEVLSALAYQEIGVLSILSLVAAVPALEMGKEELRRRERELQQGRPSKRRLGAGAPPLPPGASPRYE